MTGKILMASAAALTCLIAGTASAQSPVEQRAAARVCRTFLLNQAAQGGYDVVAEEIRLTPSIATSSNTMNVDFTVDGASVQASGTCEVKGRGNNGYMSGVSFEFVNK